MKTVNFLKYFLFLFIFAASFGAAATTTVNAQNPCPRVGPCDESPTPTPNASPTPIIPGQGGNTVTLSAFLEELVENFVSFKTAFIDVIEGTLGGYFSLLAYILAWIIAIYYFTQQFLRGEWDAGEIGKFTGRLAVCLLLLIFCGDVDGDGRRGDLVRLPGYVGYYLAFGQDSTQANGNYLNRLVTEQSDKFNRNYDAFVENKLMVKINDRDMPVRYPGVRGVQTVAAVYIGQATPQQQQEAISQEFWIGLLFQLLNICRSVISFVDFFLLTSYSFGVLVMILVAPFMVCVFVNRDLAKRFTIPFFYTVLTICVVFPAFSQVARYFAYLAGNLALGTSGQPNYTFDPTTYTIVANGDPTPMILVAVLCMLVSILFLAMSGVLSYALVQGRLVEAMNGLIANAFSGIASVGLNAAVTGYATRMQAEGEKAQIQGAYQSTMTQAGYTLEAQKASADAALRANTTLAQSGYAATMINAEAQRNASQLSALGQLMGGVANVNAEKFATINGSLANFRRDFKTMDADEKKGYADNLIELLKNNGDATSQRIAKEIELAPDKASLLAEQYENILNGVPIGGSVLKQLGINKEAMDSWMRTEGFKTMGQWMFGNPNTMQGGNFNYGAVTSKMFEQNRNLQGAMQTPSLVYQRPDGTMVDAMTGQRLSNNIIDMTNPNNLVTSGNQSVGNIFTGAANLDFKPQRGITNNRVARVLNDEMMRMGYTPNARLSVLGDIWRENNWNMGAIFAGHKDPANGAANLGIISWQGDRRDRLVNYMASQGLVQNGQIVQSDQSLRAMMRFMDGEMKTGKWGDQWRAMRNPNLSTQQVSDKMQKYVLYSEDSKYNTLENGFNVRNNRIGAEKAFNLVMATSQPTYRPRTSTQVSPSSSYSVVAPNSQSNVPYYNAKQALSTIQNADVPTAKFLGKKFSADSTWTNSLANNQKTFDSKNQATQLYFQQKRQATADYTQESIDIANQKSQIQMSGLQNVYDSQVGASNLTFGGQSEAALVTQQGSLQAGQYNWEGAMQSATLTYAGQKQAAEITKAASLEALYQRNMASLIQSVGNSTAQQISEMFERASRGM